MKRKRGSLCALCLGAAALAACGGDSGGEDERGDPTPYLGTWTYTGGELDVTCGGQPYKAPLAGAFTFTVAAGADTPLVRLQPECAAAGVPLRWKGGGATASDVRCPVPVTIGGESLVAQARFESWTMKTTDGATAATEGHGKGTGTYGGTSIECQIVERGTLTKRP